VCLPRASLTFQTSASITGAQGQRRLLITPAMRERESDRRFLALLILLIKRLM
jgi:hypothetical protein